MVISLSSSSYASGQSLNVHSPQPSDHNEYDPNETNNHQGSTGRICSVTDSSKNGTGIMEKNARRYVVTRISESAKKRVARVMTVETDDGKCPPVLQV